MTNKGRISALSAAMLAVALGGGCSSSGLTTDASTSNGDANGDAETLFGLSTGDSCFDITGVSGVDDGCMLQVSSLVGSALPLNYDMATATVTLGTSGSLGAGQISHNVGTLSRDGDTSDSTMPSCTWHQTDTSMVTLTATNAFTISVTEMESTFSTACMMTPSTCTSTWTWTMQKSTSKTFPNCK